MNTRTLIVSLALVALAVPATALAQDECNADIRGELMRKEVDSDDTTYTATVTVTARETCAMVDFILKVVEQDNGGEEFEVHVQKRIRVRDSTPSTMNLVYRVNPGRQIVSHRFEQTACRLCE